MASFEFKALSPNTDSEVLRVGLQHRDGGGISAQNTPHLKILNLITSKKSFVLCKITFTHSFQALGCEHFFPDHYSVCYKEQMDKVKG